MPEHAEGAGPVNGGCFNQRRRQAFHELLHQEQSDGSCEGRKDQRPVGVDHPQLAHDQVVRNSGHVAGEHQAGRNHREEGFSAREFIFRQHKGSHACDHKMPESTDECNEHRIDKVPAEGHKALAHRHKQISEVVRRGMGRPYGRREPEELVQGFQGRADLEKQRERHCNADEEQHQVNPDIPGDGAVRVAAGNQVFLRHLDLFAPQLGKPVQLISACPGRNRFIRPVLIHMVVYLQAIVQVKDIAAVILEDDRHLAAGSSAPDIVHAVQPGVMPLHQRIRFPFFVEGCAGIRGNKRPAILLAGDGFHRTSGFDGIQLTHLRYLPFPARQQSLSCTESSPGIRLWQSRWRNPSQTG